MPPDLPRNDRRLAPDDPDVSPGWRLLEFLLSLGADECAVRFLYAGANGRAECDRLKSRLAFAALGERTRECTVTYGRQSNPRPTEVWRFDRQSLEAIKTIVPGGILDPSNGALAWAEDLCIYRRGDLLLGIVTHEQFAFVRMSDAEWMGWKAEMR